MFEEKSERVVSQDTVGTDLFQGKYDHTSRLSEHPPTKGGRGGVKMFR